MRIVRLSAPSGYTQIPNAALRDQRLSFKARGIHANLLSNSDEGWTETADTLAERSPEGRHAVRTGLQELAKHGYIEYRKSQGKDGKWATEMVVYSSPKSGNPTPAPPAATHTNGQVGPESGYPNVGPPAVGSPNVGKPDAIQKTKQKNNQNTKQTTKISQSAQQREAGRWLNARYRLTDQESAAVVHEVQARAREPIKNLVRYLDAMHVGDLADIAAAVMDVPLEPQPPPPRPTIYAVPDQYDGDPYENGPARAREAIAAARRAKGTA